MKQLIAEAKFSPKFTKTAKTIVAVFAGSWLGALWGKFEWAGREDWCNDKNITKYECEDQINQLI
jgi:hypothetical protein